MKQPEKWKETIDPFKLKFKKFKLLEVLGYPHARNDVFYCKGIFNNEEIYCFLKYASKPDSNILNEINIIKNLNFNFIPKILECDKSGTYVITKEIEGERLSYILQITQDVSLNYMFEYGKTLAKIHKTQIKCNKVIHRKFFDIPNLEYFKEFNISFIYDFLIKNKPKEINECFCHGDFHYANILWKNRKIAGVLDWELSGIGNKEFDIAWAIINRPSQNFLKTKDEINKFIKGYKSLNNCNVNYIIYYMILIYSHFISVGKNNEEYKEFVRNFIKQLKGDFLNETI